MYIGFAQLEIKALFCFLPLYDICATFVNAEVFMRKV